MYCNFTHCEMWGSKFDLFHTDFWLILYHKLIYSWLFFSLCSYFCSVEYYILFYPERLMKDCGVQHFKSNHVKMKSSTTLSNLLLQNPTMNEYIIQGFLSSKLQSWSLTSRVCPLAKHCERKTRTTWMHD